MRLYLKNIGMLKEADVKLNGLTVIAGENDTGKSTVGKVIFSVVKGIQKYEESLEDKFKEELFKYLDDFYDKYNNIFQNEDKLAVTFFPSVFVNYILKNKTNLDKFFNSYREMLKKYNNKNLDKDFASLEKYVKSIFLHNEKNELQEEALKRAFFSEFRGQLKSINFMDTTEGIIKIFEKSNELKIKVDEKLKLLSDFELLLEDTTLIETPMILNFSDMIQNARSHFEEEELTKTLIRLEADVIYHSKDLINKLINSAKFGNNEIDENLLKILKFDFDYKVNSREFVYIKAGKEYFSINVADGIKSFGIIKLLLRGNYIRKNTLLIIDEPEVHLHPKWQIEYAKLIIELVKRNIKVLITSHSPFFIEALEILSKDLNSNFYLAKNEKNYSIIKETNLNEIYEVLGESIDILENMEIESKRW